MKIVSLSFGGFRNGRPAGMSRVLIPVFQELIVSHGAKIEHYVPQCSGYKGDVSIRTISPIYAILYRTIRVTGRMLRIPNYLTRHLSIDIYDVFARSKISYPETLIVTHLFPKTLRKNKALGGRNILVMGNPNPEKVYDIMMVLQAKYGVVIKDAYTYKPFTIDRWQQSAPYLDSIVCGSETMKNSFPSFPHLTVVSPPRVLVTDYYLFATERPAKEFRTKTLNNSRKIRFCFLAHTVWLKGLHNLLEAWDMLDTSNAELHIGGRINPQYKQWIDQQYPAQGNVVFYGRVPDIREFYMSNDVFVCPSLVDAGPGTIAEALSCGLPVIASNGCGLSEIVTDGHNGFAYRSGDVHSLCACMKICIDNAKIVNDMSYRAIQSVREAVDGNAQDYASFLRKHILSVTAQ